MKISMTKSLLLPLSLSFTLSLVQCFAPSPAPRPSVAGYSPSPAHSTIDIAGVPSAEYYSPPAPVDRSRGSAEGPASESSEEANTGKRGRAMEARWCVMEGDAEGCRAVVDALGSQSGDLTWQCVVKDSAQECLDAINKGDADIINLDAGLAYTAFLNHSMKAIASEVYCNRVKSYDAVAVVPRKFCNGKRRRLLSLMDFKGHKSCHGGYSTASGWNYPIDHIKKLTATSENSDLLVAEQFFSKICAPSVFEGGSGGVCSGCGNQNGSCYQEGLFSGNAGAFRCLVEGLGHIAFVRGDTPLLYSLEGPFNQSWSTKSVGDFMYLCPQGGCREINGYAGSCSFGSVPANVIMASNSMPQKKKLLLIEQLVNTSWIESANAARISSGQMLSPSTQEFSVIKTLTRSYLGQSALISQSLLDSGASNVEGNSSAHNHIGVLWMLLSLLLVCFHWFS